MEQILLKIGDIIEIENEQYVVIKTTCDGGGACFDGTPYPNGHHVWCRQIINDNVTEKERDFYQTGFFTNMIKNPKIIGHKELKYTLE